MTYKQPKPKKCKVCRETFQPASGLSPKVCGYKCAMELVKVDKKKANRKELRAYKEKNKTYNQRIKDAWKPCSEWVRLVRDVNEPCISCGRYDHEIKEHLRGGKWDAGHYLGKAAHPELRFHPDNISKQCKSCNGGAGQYAKKNHTVTQAYRINLIAKHDDLIDIKSWYREKVKALATL